MVVRHLRLIAANVLLAAVYAATAHAAMKTAVIQGGASPLWPAAGLALVCVIRWGRRIAPGVLFGELCVTALHGTALWAAAVSGVGNAIAAIVGAWLWTRCGGRPRIDRLRDVATLGACALLAAFITASTGIGELLASHAIDPDAAAQTWWVWWIGDVAGVLVCAPLLFFVLGDRSPPRPIRTPLPLWMEWCGWLAVVVAVAIPVLDASIGQPYVLCPVLAWLGLRLGTPAVALANLVVAIVGVRLAVTGHGPFVQDTVAHSLLASQTFLVVMAVMSLVIAAVAAELRASRRQQAALREVAEAVARQDAPEDVRALADSHRDVLVGHEAELDALVVVARDAAQTRARLLEQATTDALTGLVNHGEFHRIVAAELGRASRHGHALALAVFDLDGFKRVNDLHGHLAGDAVLRAAAAGLRDGARAEDVVARIGGDELALLMPETSGDGAIAAVERCRELIERAALGPDGDITVSAGICDLRHAQSAEGLLHRADDALYWVKAQGGNAGAIYVPGVMGEHDADPTTRRERAEALSGMRAMARAIDARDPTTRRHSERVAELAGRLAAQRGWGTDRIAALRQAALVHDVGKLAVPDAILFKPGRLDAQEYREVQRHAATGAEIASELLSPEQVTWIRGHHERHDGRGYPDALAGEAISEGAALLAIADAWDAMTVARPYSTPLSADEAMAECVAQDGAQFAPYAVRALLEVQQAALV